MRLFGLGKRSERPVVVQVFGKTDLGQTREHNEDCFLVADLTRGEASLKPEVRKHAVGDLGSLFLVADGMGGAAGGEIASAMGADSVFRHMNVAWRGDQERNGEQFALRLREAVEAANGTIHRYALEHPELKGMGTTCTAVGLFDGHLYVTQVGDSRAYLVRNGEAVQLTKDQSLMQRLVDAGELTEEEAARSERRNIILQALGPDEHIKVDLTRQQVRRGDALVLCTDGLFGQVTKDEIAELVVAREADLVAICTELVARANERGGPDNITAVVVRLEGEGLRAPHAGDLIGHQRYRLGDDTPTTPLPAVHHARESRGLRTTAALIDRGEARSSLRRLAWGAMVAFGLLAAALLLGGLVR